MRRSGEGQLGQRGRGNRNEAKNLRACGERMPVRRSRAASHKGNRSAGNRDRGQPRPGDCERQKHRQTTRPSPPSSSNSRTKPKRRRHCTANGRPHTAKWGFQSRPKWRKCATGSPGCGTASPPTMKSWRRNTARWPKRSAAKTASNQTLGDARPPLANITPSRRSHDASRRGRRSRLARRARM